MKIRLSVSNGFLFAFALVALSALPAFAANNQEYSAPFEGDPTGGFFGGEGSVGGSGGAASSDYFGGNPSLGPEIPTFDRSIIVGIVAGLRVPYGGKIPFWFYQVDKKLLFNYKATRGSTE